MIDVGHNSDLNKERWSGQKIDIRCIRYTPFAWRPGVILQLNFEEAREIQSL